MTRSGTGLHIDGPVPWSARHVAAKRSGHRVSFGDEPPVEEPVPPTWEHYAPDGVTLQGQGKPEVETFSPAEFEAKARLGYFVLSLVQNMLIATVFFFVVTMLLRVKRVGAGGRGALDVLARCLVPGCLLSGVIQVFGTPKWATLSAVTFLLVLGMNALLYVSWARPTADAEASFDV